MRPSTVGDEYIEEISAAEGINPVVNSQLLSTAKILCNLLVEAVRENDWNTAIHAWTVKIRPRGGPYAERLPCSIEAVRHCVFALLAISLTSDKFALESLLDACERLKIQLPTLADSRAANRHIHCMTRIFFYTNELRQLPADLLLRLGRSLFSIMTWWLADSLSKCKSQLSSDSCIYEACANTSCNTSHFLVEFGILLGSILWSMRKSPDQLQSMPEMKPLISLLPEYVMYCRDSADAETSEAASSISNQLIFYFNLPSPSHYHVSLKKEMNRLQTRCPTFPAKFSWLDGDEPDSTIFPKEKLSLSRDIPGIAACLGCGKCRLLQGSAKIFKYCSACLTAS